MRPTAILCRSGLAAAVATVLLTACGGDDADPASAPAETSASAESTADGSGAADDFCARAEDLDQRVETALDESDGDGSLPDVFRRLAEEMRSITAPEAIAADWDTMRTGLDRMADAVADLDISDADSVAALEEAGRGLETASDDVETYLCEECGIG